MTNIMKLIASLITFLTLIFAYVTPVFAAEPYPVDYWAIRHSVSQLDVSPDGKHLFVLKLESKDGQNVLEIYDTGDLSKPVKRLNAKPMEIFSAQWVSDTVIVGNAFDWVRNKVKGPEQSAWEFLLYSYDLETGKFKKLEPEKRTSFEGGGFTVEKMLPDEPDEILIATGNTVGEAQGADPFKLFRPRSYYRYNLKTGRKSLVLKGNDKYSEIQFTGKGEPIFASGADIDTNELIRYYRLPGQSGWTEFGKRVDADNFEDLYDIIGRCCRIVGRINNDPTKAVVIALNGEDKAALWEYDLVGDKFGRKIFGTPDADIISVKFSSNTWGEADEETGDLPMVAAIYPGAKHELHWFDLKEKKLYDELASSIPNSYEINITSRSRDGNTMIVTNSGPHDPGSFWLVENGKMAKLGSRNPLLKAEDLADVEYIRYPARDGMIIPAYVTKPKGTGPFPLIVLPHGGPHVNEVIVYNEWSQMLANNGYMVLQPEYRMSTGWGKKHFDAGMDQHGLAMQDDKDDGAQYLVKKGWVDPDRMAMFGWSYGGYAALVAASRSPNLYQCVVAGAAVADAKKVYLKRSGANPPKATDHWSRARGGFSGINPINEVDKVNVPVFMVHGDLDSRVLYFNYKDYKKKMEAAGKPGKFLTLKQAEHFSVFLSYKNKKLFYTQLLDFLQNDCGPGGL